MDFLIVPIAAGPPGAPAAVAARGPDPLITLPPNHALRRINGLVLIVPPGAMVAIGNCLHASTVESLLGEAIFVGTEAAPTTARNLVPIVVGVLPTKLDAVITQLEAEPAGVGLVPNATYASVDAFVLAVGEAVGRLSAAAVSPIYHLQAADTYALDPVAAGAPVGYGALTVNPTFLTFGMLANAHGFLTHFGFFSFVCFGRHMSGSRDPPGNPTRVFLQTLGTLCTAAGFQRATGVAGAFVTASALMQWFEATQPSVKVSFLYETGFAIDRREQCYRDRHNLVFGTAGGQSCRLCGCGGRAHHAAGAGGIRYGTAAGVAGGTSRDSGQLG